MANCNNKGIDDNIFFFFLLLVLMLCNPSIVGCKAEEEDTSCCLAE